MSVYQLTDFLCVSDSNLSSILHRLRNMAHYCSSFRCRQGVPLFNTRWSRKFRIATFGLRNYEHLLMYSVKCISMSRTVRRDLRVWETGRQTNKGTVFMIANAALHYSARPRRDDSKLLLDCVMHLTTWIAWLKLSARYRLFHDRQTVDCVTTWEITCLGLFHCALQTVSISSGQHHWTQLDATRDLITTTQTRAGQQD